MRASGESALDFQHRTLFDSFSVNGTWWAVGSARRRIPGTLHVIPSKGITLELRGVLRRPKEPSDDITIRNEPTIVGTTDDGQSITLVTCLHKSRGPAGDSFAPKLVVVGAHLRNFFSARMKWFYLSTTNLEEWVG